MCTLTWQR